MAQKLSSRQQAQMMYLQTLPPKLSRIRHTIEALSAMQADEVAVRQMSRMLDEIKAGAQAQGFGALAETAGLMGTMARRGGGLQMKVRGLRELLGSLDTNLEGALKKASSPEAADEAS